MGKRWYEAVVYWKDGKIVRRHTVSVFANEQDVSGIAYTRFRQESDCPRDLEPYRLVYR